MRSGQIDLIALIAGFVIWSAGFVILYTAQALGCAYGWGDWHRPLLVALYVVVLLPLGWLALRPPQGERRALAVAALWANRAALLAGVLVFFPVTFTSLCL